ncbi:MAG: phospholipid carrier-dependent glycosyltransferase, partial [Planctomycetota bacterium]
MTKKKHRNVRHGEVQDAGPARGVKGRHVKERPPPVKSGPDWLAAHVKGWPVAVAVVLLLGAFAAQAITSMRQKCTTFDEIAHLPAGYSYLKMGDFRMNPEHPPLGKMIAAVPLLFHNLDGAFDSRSWQTGDEWTYGREFFFGGRKGNDADTILFWGRLPMVALSLCLGLLVFFWARKMYGNAAGLFALFLFAFSPNFIAHGRLANTDVPIAFFVLLSLFCFDRALRRLTPLSAALAGVTLGLALLAKFSGLLMLPVFLIVAFIRLVDGSSMEVRFRKSFTVGMWRRKLPVMLVLFAVMIAITYVVV